MDINNEYGIKDIQEKLLEILRYFDKFCKENNLKYVLAGGTLLGAVRNKGIIPWDDDLDVFMLREDYERLIKIWDEKADTKNYSCLRSNDKYNIHHAATEIKDNNTTFINNHSKDLDINHGLMIDVIPLDNIPSSKFKRIYQKINAFIFSCYNFQRLPNHKSKLIYYMTYIALKLVPSFKLKYKIWKKAEDNMIRAGKVNDGMIASIIEGPTIMNQIFPKEWVENPAYLEFEDMVVPVPRDYHSWLEMSYGEYMIPPKKEDRVLRHDIFFYDMNTPYKKYRGIKYFTKGEKC